MLIAFMCSQHAFISVSFYKSLFKVLYFQNIVKETIIKLEEKAKGSLEFCGKMWWGQASASTLSNHLTESSWGHLCVCHHHTAPSLPLHTACTSGTQDTSRARNKNSTQARCVMEDIYFRHSMAASDYQLKTQKQTASSKEIKYLCAQM